MNRDSSNISNENPEVSYGSVLKELTSTATDVIGSEIGLLKTELKNAAPNLTKHAAQTGLFGALFALSVFPLLAFAVIGLGILLGGMYWLSALIVGVICACVGAYFGRQAFQKLKSQDIQFTRTKDGIARALHMFEAKIHEVKNATHGGSHESSHFH